VTVPQAFQIAVQHHQAGRLAEAEALYRRILAAQPNHADALHFLGVIAHQIGRHDVAVEWLRKSIALNPDNPIAHSHLGEACRALGRIDEAIAHFRGALQVNPGYANAWYNLGNALQNQGQLEEAIAAYRRALELKPHYPEAHNNLGNALKDRGQFDEAIAAYRRALRDNPDLPEIHTNLGNMLREQGHLDDAIAAYRRAIQLKPDFPEAYGYLGNALRERRQFDEAIAACRRVLELQPGFPEAQSTLGAALAGQGKLDEAISAFQSALLLKPDDARTHSNLIYTLHFHPGHNARTIAAERQRWNRQFGAPRNQSAGPYSNDCKPDRTLRIGYVSPDFRSHVVGRNLLPLFERHDPREFEILCYSGVTRPDPLTEQFRRRALLWRNTVGVTDESLAKMIRRDGVDILVDLSQHLAGNRLPLFARQPAPIQVSFAGYPESAGLEAIKYRISDRHLEASAADAAPGSKEQVCLIDSFWCYDPGEDDMEVTELPARESGRITFGCLNNLCKVNEPTLIIWARVLGKAPDSRLVLMADAGSHRQRTLETLGREGVDAHRVEFVEYRPRREYLETYHRLDIVLDTAPYNGHTTSLDALWMGVPVVSLAGETPVSRAGLSQLTNLGLRELVAHSEEDYVRIATELSRNLPGLADLRSTMRSRMKASVLMDAPRFARQVEQAYRDMWQAWCARHSPLPIE